MKKVQKRILTVIVSLTITGSGIATYLRYSGNSFDPEKYTRNSAWNRNQITFDDDQTDDEYMNSEKQDDTTEDSRQLEQDDNADQAQTPSEQRDNAILFEYQTPQNLNVPALITQDTDGGSGDGAAVSPQQASQNVTSYLVGDRSGSASGSGRSHSVCIRQRYSDFRRNIRKLRYSREKRSERKGQRRRNFRKRKQFRRQPE